MEAVDGACAEEGKAKGLDDGGHGIGEDDPLEAFGDGGDGVDDGRGIHQQLDAEGHQEAQVTVFGGEGGDDDAKSQPEAGHHQDQERGERDPDPIGLNLRAAHNKEGDEGQKENELNGKGDQVGNQDRNRDRHARKIHLAEQVGILHKGIGGLVQALGEIGPDDGARQVEEELGQPVGGQPRDLPKDKGKGEGGQQGLDEIPERTQNGLLVDGHKITTHKEEDEIAILP